MPVRIKGATPTASGGRVRINFDDALDTPDVSPTPTTDEGSTDFFTPAGLAGAAALAAGAALHLKANPGALSKLLNTANSVRQQLMLSGLAIPKTILGNVGGATIASAERRSAAPLTELLSSDTLRDFIAEYKAGAPGHVQTAGSTMHGPGRVLGAIDEATQRAMARAGLSADEAERLTFQTPLNQRFGKFGQALDSPAMRYLLPFRRTPFNTFYEGAETFKDLNDPVRAAMLAGSMAAGAAHGAATANEQHPMSIGLGAAAANRYALPYIIGAAGGRALAGGTDPSSVGGEALPVSEYGLTSGVTNPLQSFTNPAAVRVLRRLLGE